MTAPWFGCTPNDFPTQSAGANASAPNLAPTGRSDYSCHLNTSSYAEYVQSPQQSTRTAGGSGITRAILATYTSGNTLLAWLNDAGIEVLRVRSTGVATFQLQYWNGSGWTGIGSGGAVTGGTSPKFRFQVDWTGLGGGSGTLRFRIVNDSTEAVVLDESASSLSLTSATNVDRLRVYSAGNTNSSYFITEGFIKDGSAETAYVFNEQITANGTDTDGTGGEPEMDELTYSNPDGDFASLSATGERRSVTAPARVFGGRNVKGLGFVVRLRRGASGPTDVNPYLKIGGTRYYHPSSPVALTTSFLDYWFGWDQDPSTASAWGATNAQSASLEYGIEVD